MSQKKLKPGVYYCPETLEMIEVIIFSGEPIFYDPNFDGLAPFLFPNNIYEEYKYLGEV